MFSMKLKMIRVKSYKIMPFIAINSLTSQIVGGEKKVLNLEPLHHMEQPVADVSKAENTHL